MEMEGWFVYALVGMLAFGLYNFLLKVSVDSRFGDLNPTTAVLAVSLAIFASALSYGVYTGNLALPSRPDAIAIVLLIGILWTAGTVALTLAFQKGNASQTMPILNANVLVVMALSFVFLGEAASLQYLVKVLVGAGLILAGIFVLA